MRSFEWVLATASVLEFEVKLGGGSLAKGCRSSMASSRAKLEGLVASIQELLSVASLAKPIKEEQFFFSAS